MESCLLHTVREIGAYFWGSLSTLSPWNGSAAAHSRDSAKVAPPEYIPSYGPHAPLVVLEKGHFGFRAFEGNSARQKHGIHKLHGVQAQASRSRTFHFSPLASTREGKLLCDGDTKSKSNTKQWPKARTYRFFVY